MCKVAAQVQPGEAGRLIADFVAPKGGTTCPTRYPVPIEQLSQFVRHTPLTMRTYITVIVTAVGLLIAGRGLSGSGRTAE